MDSLPTTESDPVYTCRYEGCTCSYKSKFSLKRHYLSHQGVRNHRCPYCDKGFSLAQYLREHIHIHTGDKPFVCPYPGCGKQFRQAGKLSIHRKEHSTIGSHETGHSPEDDAEANLKAVEAVFDQLRNFAIPKFFYSKVLPIPEQIMARDDMVQYLKGEYARYKEKTVVSIVIPKDKSPNAGSSS